MKTIRAKVQNRFLISTDPVDWPEGTVVELTAELADNSELRGMTEDEQGDSPEAIQNWLKAFDAIPPMTLTPEEEAAWLADRKAQREFELAASERRAERLRSMVE